MKIKSLQLKNFKRFTDVTLQGIPGNAKLVLLIGSNGSGKSCVFDAFERIATERKEAGLGNFGGNSKFDYYSKKRDDFYYIRIENQSGKILRNADLMNEDLDQLNNFYGRTSFRQIPKLTRTSLGKRFNIQFDGDRPRSFIERDERFENDLEHIFGILLKEFFRTTDNKSEIKEKVVNPINAAFENIFSKESGTALRLLELIPPLEGKTAEVNFKKGNSTFHYNYLSAGEKEVFNILINLIARKEYYQDTIYFFDEIDLHLNTKLQYNFLKEITENWIPENCQLWTASHSLGFIQYAKESENAVVFDLDDYDFDYPKVLSPEPKDSADIYDIAVSKELLPELFKGYEIVFVENQDRKYYASLNIERTLFVPKKNRDGVFHKSKAGLYKGIVDRDFLTDEDISVIEQHYPFLKVLRFYCVENYLFHPDNIEEYSLSKGNEFDKEQYIRNIFAEKEKIKNELIIKVASIRQGYPYFKEAGMEKSPNKKRFTPDDENFTQTTEIVSNLNSDDFSGYYKSFSMKDYAKGLQERQNINPVDLSKTTWFKTQIENLIK